MRSYGRHFTHDVPGDVPHIEVHNHMTRDEEETEAPEWFRQYAETTDKRFKALGDAIRAINDQWREDLEAPTFERGPYNSQVDPGITRAGEFSDLPARKGERDDGSKPHEKSFGMDRHGKGLRPGAYGSLISDRRKRVTGDNRPSVIRSLADLNAAWRSGRRKA